MLVKMYSKTFTCTFNVCTVMFYYQYNIINLRIAKFCQMSIENTYYM